MVFGPTLPTLPVTRGVVFAPSLRRVAAQVEDWFGSAQALAGTPIPASLVTGINSDLPGTIVAQVTQPVCDTVTEQYLLIPQGARLIGRYQSDIPFGQDRALVNWERIIFPDGSSIVKRQMAILRSIMEMTTDRSG